MKSEIEHIIWLHKQGWAIDLQAILYSYGKIRLEIERMINKS